MKALRLSHLTKIYVSLRAEIKVVHNLSLNVEEGEVFGFLGPNGAGKTTTLKMIVGLMKPNKGKITIFGRSNTDQSTKAQIGFMPEQPSFYPYLTGREVLDFLGRLSGLTKNVRQERSREVLDKVGLGEAAGVRVQQYSKGMNQRLGIAAAVINDPRIIFLDEPLDGLDPLGRRQVKELIKEWRQQGKTVFFNSHILSDVEEICDRVGILDEGKLIAEGRPGELARGAKNLEDYFVRVVTEQRKR